MLFGPRSHWRAQWLDATSHVGVVCCSSCFTTSGQQFFLQADSGVFCRVCQETSEVPWCLVCWPHVSPLSQPVSTVSDMGDYNVLTFELLAALSEIA